MAQSSREIYWRHRPRPDARHLERLPGRPSESASSVFASRFRHSRVRTHTAIGFATKPLMARYDSAGKYEPEAPREMLLERWVEGLFERFRKMDVFSPMVH